MQTTSNEVEIREKFRISYGRWVVLCFHNAAYSVWEMDEFGSRTNGTTSESLSEAMEVYEERVCSLVEPTP